MLLVPGVIPDLFNGESLLWISVQNSEEQTPCIITDKARNVKVSIHNLLVQDGGVSIFEREEPAYHCIEDDS